MQKKLSQWIFAFIFSYFLIALSVIITLNFRPLYYYDIEALHLTDISGMSADEIKENYDVLIDYNSMFSHDDLVFPSLPMSEHGRIHFEEVKDIFVGFEYSAVISAVIVIAGIWYFFKKRHFLFLKITAIINILLPVGLGLLIGSNFDWAFVAFHRLAFDNDYWIFDEISDPIITLLPDTFFFQCAAMILILLFIFSIICLVLYKISKKHKRAI